MKIVNDKVAISIYFNISLANSREKIRIKEKSNTTKLVFSIFKGFHDQLNLNKSRPLLVCLAASKVKVSSLLVMKNKFLV